MASSCGNNLLLALKPELYSCTLSKYFATVIPEVVQHVIPEVAQHVIPKVAQHVIPEVVIGNPGLRHGFPTTTSGMTA